MPTISQVLFVQCMFTTLDRVFSLHGHSLQDRFPGHSSAESPIDESVPASAAEAEPVAPPPPALWSLPWSQAEPAAQEAAKLGTLLVQPLDRIGIALPELKMQRFGSKCIDCDEVSAAANAHDAAKYPRIDIAKGAMDFFQVGAVSEQVVEGPRNDASVGEVVADHPVLTQENGTAPNEPSQVGFVAAAKPPPALSELPPLPFIPDEIPALLGHIHVEANIATQEVSDKSDHVATAATATSPLPMKQSGAVISGATMNASVEDEAWINFTAAEALHGHNHDAEALGIDAAAEALPNLPPAASVTGHPALNDATPPTAHPPPAEKVQPSSPPVIASVDHPATTAKPKVASVKVETASPTAGFIARHSMLLFWLLAFAFMGIIGGCLACAGAGFLASFVWQRRLAKTTTRSMVEDLTLCRASEVERRLPVSGNYDCMFSKPLSSCTLLRLEARIEGPAAGNSVLTAPLTGQACVLYSVAVSRQLHDGIHPAPVAFASGSIDFVISLKDSPHVKINLQAEEVSLFDMRRGRHVQRRSFSAAPDKWQDFILTHRAGTEWQTSAQLHADSSSLEFQECALLCNTTATFVGELHRGADGQLSLRPLQQDSLDAGVAGIEAYDRRSEGLSERWRTSWECGGCEASNIVSHPPSPREKHKDACDKVVASDDPLLLDGGSSLINVMSGLLRRLFSGSLLRGGRSMAPFWGGKKRPVPENHTL